MEIMVDSYSAKQKVEEINKFVDVQRSTKALNKTKSDINTWERFFASVSEVRNLSKIPPVRLNELHGQFFVEILNKDGAEYEPDTVTSLKRSIARMLKEQGSKFNILMGKKVQWSRAALSAKRKELVVQGCENKPNTCRLTLEEENKLFESGQFGCQEPLPLQRTFWWFLSLHFKFWARDEIRNCARVMFALKNIRTRETKCLFGKQSKARRPEKAKKEVTDGNLIPNCKPQTPNAAQYVTTSCSPANGQNPC